MVYTEGQRLLQQSICSWNHRRVREHGGMKQGAWWTATAELCGAAFLKLF
jgi:hypothetical protein